MAFPHALATHAGTPCTGTLRPSQVGRVFTSNTAFLMEDSSRFLAGTLRTESGGRVDQFALSDSAAIRFLAEQDGDTEREFKARLVPVFRQHETVQAAYLAIVQYRGEAEVSVALCILFSNEEVVESIVAEASEVFYGMFNRNEHLDILPISHDQWELLRAVCKPFYVRESKDSA
jgi:hypothetical protein